MDEINREKQLFLFKLEKYRRKGYDSLKKYNLTSSLEDIEAEVERVEESYFLDQSIKMQRKVLMGVVNGAEWLNKMYDPFDLYLDLRDDS